jgi:hypothetical protein
MSTTITGVVTNGVVVPNSPLPEGATVEVVVVVVAPANASRQDTSALEVLESVAPGPRGVPAEQVRGIAAGDGGPPNDDTVNRWVQEHRVEKYG